MKKLGKALILSTSIVTGAASITFSPLQTMKIEASSSISITKTSFQTITSLPVHSGAGTSYKNIYTIPKGGIVSATVKNGSWYKVSYIYSSKGKNTVKTGWVNENYLKEYNQLISEKNYYVSNKTANLYPAPNTSKKCTYTVSSNNGFYSTQKVVNSIGQTWYRVTFNGKTLYISSSYVTKSSFVSFSPQKYKAVKETYVYQGLGNAYKKLKTIPKGAIITSAGRIGNWYAVSYGGAAGFINSSDFSKYSPITYKTTSTNTTYYFTNKTVKFYPSADLLQAAVYSVPSSTGFASTKKVENSLGQTWYQISYNGQDLYVQSTDAEAATAKTFSQLQLQANQNTVIYQSFGSVFKPLATIQKNEKIKVTQKINNWYLVSYKGITGYVYSTNFSVYTPPVTYQDTPTSAAYYFTNKTAVLYSSPDTNSKTVATMDANNGFASSVIGTNSENKDTFYKVSFNNQNLYVKSTDVTSSSFTSFTSAPYQAKVDTYLYQSFGNDFNKLIKIPKNTVLKISKKINSWYSVSYGNQTGYAFSGDFSAYTPQVTEQAITPTTYDTTTSLNVRKSADASADLLTTIPGSTIVIASAKTSNNWYKVTYNGKTGYASGSYLNQVITGDPLTAHDGYQFIDLRTHSNVTAAQINNYIASYVESTGKKSILTNKGQAFIDAGNKYGVNALYLAAHAILESAYGTSTIALAKNNLFGYHAYDADPFIAAYKFSSVEDCIDYAARVIKVNYLTPTGSYYKTPILGFKTTDMSNTRIDANSIGMNYYYASDQNWGKSIARHMQNILAYNKNDYADAQPDTSVQTYPAIPVAMEVFPPGVTAIAKKNLTLNSAKGILDNVKTLSSGSSFTFVEKTNDDWVELQTGGQTYWTHDINFYTFKSCLSVKNLGRATTYGLNVRTGPGTSYPNVLDQNSNNISIDPTEYISINLNKDGSLAMDSTKQWYNVTLANGQTGWVGAKYVTFELQ
ncbi:SH3 domain-containing protein [Heyndrickxia acidicola]|uniref:SH3 domain-containing protein n=1 Tax=Heyndrickxia acidicola TaxID=209389 RepID=A0ABU6MJA0_9BACI|nr:SH3 domain-containing protein [Heyndrickxia acidicola]MED1204549.1 SH3 domain-containing protein [Heyndrickxia acidicola]